MKEVVLVVFFFFLSVTVTEILQVPVDVAMTFVFTTRHTLAVEDFMSTFAPDGIVSFMRFTMVAWLTEITNLIDSSTSELMAGTVVEVGDCGDGVGGRVVSGLLDGGTVVVGADVEVPIFMRSTLNTEPCFNMPAMTFSPLDNGAMSKKNDSCVVNGSTIPLVPKFESMAPERDIRATPEKLALRLWLGLESPPPIMVNIPSSMTTSVGWE